MNTGTLIDNNYLVGIDIGSTTAKIAVLDKKYSLIFSKYIRHNAKILETLIELFVEAKKELGNCTVKIRITGSAGIGISEKAGIPFVQEVVAASEVIHKLYPKVKTLIDIGGEDSKMIFFHESKAPDIRMNGSCAGGTGAFIDQMATLLNVHVSEFNELASGYSNIYTIASRCGVFAKTDVQNLLSRKISKSDIAASVYHAVAVQAMNTLARGFDIVPIVMFSGGPFTFMPELKNTFIRDLKLKHDDVCDAEHSELLPAIGSALVERNSLTISFDDLIERIKKSETLILHKNRLNPLFKSDADFEEWNKKRIAFKVPRKKIDKSFSGECYLGIDSGSTTTKICLINSEKKLLYNFYANSKGNPIETVLVGLNEIKAEFEKFGIDPIVKRSAVIGYGEDLIKAAFNIDDGIVETIAHYNAARYFDKNVSFIMDIGGQDMKAIFIENELVNRIELNESCSAGCGSFIETFGNSLGYSVVDFAELACKAKAPSNLGTRCTVFMNSKVKQSLRENATVGEIAAGLSISVIKNALYKVLKLKDISELGNHIVVQGGAFRNPSIHKALEEHTGKRVICSDMPEQMGAYGAAIYALEKSRIDNSDSKFPGFDNLKSINEYTTKNIQCRGCENNCRISKFTFWNENDFFSGNKCEKFFFNKGSEKVKGYNLFDFKNNLLVERPTKTNAFPKLTLGIPRVLNFYENFPFWNTLFNGCGINVELSDASTMPLYEKGLGTVMSDSICFPAKVVHGHIYNLVEKKVDRIFYPMVLFEQNEFNETDNSYNCPLVSNYADVIKSSINPEKNFKIPIDTPTITFKDYGLLLKACSRYLKQFRVKEKTVKQALTMALSAQRLFKNQIVEKGIETINNARKNKRLLVVLAGRPYHVDPLINQKTPAALTDLGVDVISEDAVPFESGNKLDDLQIISQWSYTNRIYHAAKWVASKDYLVQFIEMNSFGCGPDAIVIDENTEILKSKGKALTHIRVDEITSTGSVRLRLRSMIESVKMMEIHHNTKNIVRENTPVFNVKDKDRLIIGPYFAYIYSDLIPSLFQLAGYNLINLPEPDKESVKYGLKYANNEICFPATIIVGDVIKALSNGDYNHDQIAVAICQTGGQCRASTYLSLIKKGLISAGFKDIPVISLGTAGKTINPQPGFDVDWKKLLPITFTCMLYADSISKMYHVAKARELEKGSAKRLTDIYIKEAFPFIISNDKKGLIKKLEEAVSAFNKLNLKTEEMPAIGIVGEIYVKYSSFGHQFIVDWLIEQGIEVVIPPIIDFFIQEFVNYEVNKKSNLKRGSWSDIIIYFLEKKANRLIQKVEQINKKFRFYRPIHNIRHIAHKASQIVDLSAQFGEGWLIPAEIATFAEDKINGVISVQPFGCIANHVVSKGVEKRIKDLFPNMNILFLDFDADTSEVNVLNRLHFMVENLMVYR
jgi:predicted CoA-substrate-specific enzyme activase